MTTATGTKPTVLRVGVATSRATGSAAMYQRLIVKRSTKFRVWPVAGDSRFLEMDPSEWRDKYKVAHEFKTEEPGRPT